MNTIHFQIAKELDNALELHRKGILSEALIIYDKILLHDPYHADAWHLKGVAAYDGKKYEEAEKLIRKAIEFKPGCALFHYNLGLALTGMGDYERALDEFITATELQNDYEDALYRTGLTLHNLGRVEVAVGYYEKVLAINPGHAETWNNLGNIASDLVRPHDALTYYSRAIECAPDFAEGYNNLGCLYSRLNDTNNAEFLFKKALALKPDFHEALNNLGNNHKKKGEWKCAIECFERSLSMNPDSVETLYSMADGLRSAGQVDDALALFVKTAEIKPDHGHAVQQIVSILSSRCDWKRMPEYQERLRRLTEKAIEEGSDCPESPFSCLGRYPDEGYARSVTRAWSSKLEYFVEQIGLSFSFEQRMKQKDSIVLGYLSNNVKNHPNAHLILGLLKRHDRERFKVTFYSYSENDESDYRKKIEEDCDAFYDIYGWSYVDAAEKINADGVDILIDLTGYTLGSMMEICALRPAPVQVRYLGFPGSMQASFFDYFITDMIMTPPDQQDYYTEKFVYMPHCYQINDAEQEIASTFYKRHDFGLPDNGFVFCSFNSAYKLEPVMFGIWMDILKSVDASVLWLLRENSQMEENLKKEAEERGVDPSRLVFSDKMPKNEHLARLKLADLALDTRLVGGHITTSDALWAGVPVITMIGSHFISRAPASILTHVGLPDLITDSPDEYLNLAVTLGMNRTLTDMIKEKLKKNRSTAPLFDSNRFVKNFDKALVSMWELFVQGKSPEQIRVNDE